MQAPSFFLPWIGVFLVFVVFVHVHDDHEVQCGLFTYSVHVTSVYCCVPFGLCCGLWIAVIIGIKHSAQDLFLSFVWLLFIGDQIVSVNGQPVMGKSYSQVIELILSR